MNHAKEHLPFLDGIRGVAILAVFLYHSLGASFGLYQLPWAGMFRDFDTSRSYLLLYPFTYGFAGVAVLFWFSVNWKKQVEALRSGRVGFGV
jgi:peptidoglycan/LPS O-acetylase OafA/YrhL